MIKIKMSTSVSVDIRKRLELWREQKREQEREQHAEAKLRWNCSTRVDHKTPTNNKSTRMAALSSSKKRSTQILCHEKDAFISPSKRGTSKDSSLNMRKRLELWLEEKGRTPQQNALVARKTPKTPCTTATTNPRRKTCSFVNDIKRKQSIISATKSRASAGRGILKTRSLTEQKKRTKSCSFVFRGQENEKNDCNVSLAAQNSPSRNLVVNESRLAKSLEKCCEMINKGHSDQDDIVFALDDIQRDDPNALRYAQYWICRARLAENTGDYDRAVCMFEQAVTFSAQPEDEIQIAFNELKAKRREKEKENLTIQDARFRTPRKTPSRELAALDGEVFPSSVVRFCVMDSTPSRRRERPASEKRVITPVRRTSRWERSGINHPKSIEEKHMTVTSLDELSDQLRSNLVFKPNSLLPCDLNEELRDCL